MTDLDLTAQVSKKYRLVRHIVLSVLLIFVVVSIAIVAIFSTDRGSQFLLDRVLERQNMLRYQYVDGNLWNGIQLKDFELNLATVEVQVDQAEINLGWRAILNKEIHLNTAKLGHLTILNKKPATDEAFQFNKIQLPFVLRADQLNVEQLQIKNPEKTVVNFYDIDLKKVIWRDTALQFVDSNLRMDYLTVKNATGDIKFEEKYPLNVVGEVNLPALHQSLNIHDIKVVATGSLDTIEAGVATLNPDLVAGWVVLHPVRQHVPMFGELKFKNYHWPFVPEQKLFTQNGVAEFKGNIQHLDLIANTDLAGKDIPEAQYQAQMSTDLTTKLHIHDFNAQILQGDVNLQGELGWKDYFRWDVKANITDIDAQDEWIPQIVRDFLPQQTNASLVSQGKLQQGLQIQANVDFAQAEDWQLHLKQGHNKAKAMQIDVAWQDLNRTLPYVGALNSPSGQAKINLVQQNTTIQASLNVAKHEQSMLPIGAYHADLNLRQHQLNLNNFRYQDAQKQGSLTGEAQVTLAHGQQPLKWQANLQAQQLNPQSILATAPVDVLQGQIQASGVAQPQQHIIQLNKIDLKGRLAKQNEHLHLSGTSGLAFLFQQEKQGGGLKSFAVNYDGYLNASHLKETKGVLNFKIAGTPKLIQISQFNHQGVMGNLTAQGQVNLDQTLAWNVKAALQNFKPQYVLANVQGDISGQLQTDGQWTAKNKNINIQRLELTGTLNQKPIHGTGNLALQLKTDGKGLQPQHFQANQLQLSYAGNTLKATGNEQGLKLSLYADQLSEIYSGLRGKVVAQFDVGLQPQLKINTKMAIDHLGYKQLLSVQKIRLQGELPTSNHPTVLNASLAYLRQGKHEIQAGDLQLSGTQQAHVLNLKANNRLSKFSMRIAGGLNNKKQWLGQIQQGDFNSYRTHLVQQQPASVVIDIADKSIWMGAHCWKSQQSQICADQPIEASPQQAKVSLITQNLNLSDFAAFMPADFILTGYLNGHAKAAWKKGSHPKIDMQLLTKQGSIGVVGEDPQAISTLNYDQVTLTAQGVEKELQVGLEVKTPHIGTAYAQVVIEPYQAHKPMRGQIALNQIQLKVLRPFIPDARRLEGVLSVGGKLSGTLQRPILNGDIRLKDGAISFISLPVNLTNIQLYSAIRHNYASIEGAFNSGRGVGKLQGQVDWRNQPRINLNLTGEDLYIRQAPLISALISPKVSLDVYPTRRRIEVKGVVPVSRALISMPEASAPVVNVSSDVRIVHEGRNQLETLKRAKPWDIRADIDVSLGNQVIFQGFDSRVPLTGRLYLTQRGLETAMRANGAIGIANRVKIDAYGQSLDLNRAIARFNGPLSNPTLDIDANKNVQGNLVGFRVVGTATRPNIQIYNDAGLSEQEALNALITGRINDGTSAISQTEGFKSDVNNTIAAAGISMGLGGTRALTNQIGRTLGLTGLALDAQGTGDDTQVSLTGYITPDLFLRYGVGVFTPVNKLTLRYQMNKRLYLEASQSVERAIDVFYHWRF